MSVTPKIDEQKQPQLQQLQQLQQQPQQYQQNMQSFQTGSQLQPPLQYPQQQQYGIYPQQQQQQPQHPLLTQQSSSVDALLQNQMNAPPRPNFPFMATGAPNTAIDMANGLLNLGQPTNQFEPVDFNELNTPWEQVFPPEDRKAMRKDFDALEKMSVFNCLTTMYTLYLSHETMKSDPKYLMCVLSGFYKKNYEVLFAKYPSLHIYVDFCLAIIIFQSAKDLKAMCSVPNIGTNVSNPMARSLINRLIRTRKPTSATNRPIPQPNQPIIHAPVVDTFEQKCAKHPLLTTKVVQEFRLAFNIGECLQYCIPTEFMPLFCTPKIGIAKRIMKGGSVSRKALVIALTRPAISSIWTRQTKDKKNEFYYLQTMDVMSELITKMTELQPAQYPFDYGRVQDLQVSLINESKASKSSSAMVFTDGNHNITLIDRINIFRLANLSFTAKSFSKTVYVLNDKVTTEFDQNVVDAEIEKEIQTRGVVIDDYEATNGITDEDLSRKLPWAIYEDEDLGDVDTDPETNNAGCDDENDAASPSKKPRIE